MTLSQNRIRKFENDHPKFVYWFGALFRSLVGLAATAVAIYALLESIFPTFLPTRFDGWDPQYLRDFSVLMVSYGLLCFVKYTPKEFAIDFTGFLISFALWTVGFLLFINEDELTAFSSVAVVVTILVLVLGPIVRGDTKTVWHDRPV